MASKQIKISKKFPNSNVSARAREFWLASLGAVSIARRQGEKLFATLVNEGQQFQAQTGKIVDSVSGDVKKQVGGVVKKVATRAKAVRAKVEARVEDSIGGALSRMGVPSREDIQELSRRVAELNKQVKAAGQKSA